MKKKKKRKKKKITGKNIGENKVKMSKRVWKGLKAIHFESFVVNRKKNQRKKLKTEPESRNLS